MLSFPLFLCLLVPLASTSYFHYHPTPSSTDDTIAYAVDYQETGVSPAHVRCLRASTYGMLLVGAFLPHDDGILDSHVIDTIKTAHAGGMRVEVHMHVKFDSKLSGAEQLDIVVNALEDSGIRMRSIWILVCFTSMPFLEKVVNFQATTLTMNESEWPMFNQTASFLFLKNIVDRAKKHGLSVGIYTSSYDWDRIVGKRSFGSDVILWYHNVRRPGLNGETKHNFEDFQPFGPFKKPTIKQFAHAELLCQLKVSRNIYEVSSLVPFNSVSSPPNGFIYVGGNFKT